MELLRDARRFILSYKRAIEIAPLQVYASALVFSPTRSLFRELFEKEEPNWITLKPRMESSWNACLQTLEGHGDSVNSVMFSADGQHLASSSHDGTVKIWDATTGACVQTLEGYGDSVNSVVFSANGQRLASSSRDKIVKIWDATTGACVQTLEGHDYWVNSVAFSADGQRLASSSDDKTVKIWDATTGTCVQTLEGHGYWVNSVVFSADGQHLASSSHDRTVKIWDAATGACVQTLNVGRMLSRLSFDPTTNSLLTTDIGLLNLDHPALPPAIDDRSTAITLRDIHHSGWGISTDGVWIVKDREEMLWLPPDYRVEESAVVGSTVAIGCRSGRVLVMTFS
jgi:WD40 repeat protein